MGGAGPAPAFGSLGTLATTLWDRGASLHHAQLIEHITRIREPAAGGLDAPQSTALMNRLIDPQAFLLSANDIFLTSLQAVTVVALAKADELEIEATRQREHLEQFAHLRRRRELLHGTRGAKIVCRFRIAAARELFEHAAGNQELRLGRKTADCHTRGEAGARHGAEIDVCGYVA